MGREFEPLRGHLKIRELLEKVSPFLLGITDEFTGVLEGALQPIHQPKK
jgi:hypothetical protein